MSFVKKFKEEFPLEKRLIECERIINKYPDRIPVICERNPRCKNVPEIDRHKYLVPSDLTMRQFIYVIRKRIKLKPEQALFIFIGNILPPTNEKLSEIYEKFKRPDKFLTLTYSGKL